MQSLKKVFHSDVFKSNPNYLFLNCPLDERIIQKIHASKHRGYYAADGGCNRLYDGMKRSKIFKEIVPEVIIGDMDSIRREVLQYYVSKGSEVKKLTSQDRNDLEKALEYILTKETEPECVDCYGDECIKLPTTAVVGHGGRMDQDFATINQLYKAGLKYPNKQVILINNICQSEILLPGYLHVIPSPVHYEENPYDPKCGILPLGDKSVVTSKGLKWELDNDVVEFGGIVSTSNQMVGKHVEIFVDSPVIWTVQLNAKNNYL